MLCPLGECPDHPTSLLPSPPQPILREGRQQRPGFLAETGRKVDHSDLGNAFHEVRVVSVKAGEMLLQAEAPASFVYIPLGDGLQVFPPGTHALFPALPWVQSGNTGVIRGATRNARMIAEHNVALLSIPKEIYLQHWYMPYTVQEFTYLCAQGNIQAMLQPAARTCKGVTT